MEGAVENKKIRTPGVNWVSVFAPLGQKKLEDIIYLKKKILVRMSVSTELL